MGSILTPAGWVTERGPLGTVWWDPDPGQLVTQDGLPLQIPGGSSYSLPAAPGELANPSTWSARKLLMTAAVDTPAATVYWPWVIRTNKIAAPLGKFYMYFSTDHDAGAGGIYMSYADSPLGPWKSYGLVYQDLAAGSTQTETPSVVWDPYTSQFRMFYQQGSAKYGAGDASSAIGLQSTLCATSTNGINWTKVAAFVLDVPALADTHGDGHTGYFLPFTTRRGSFAYSLFGGGDSPDFVLWRQDKTPAAWITDGVSLGYSNHLTVGAPLNGRRVEWNTAFVVESGGAEYLVMRLSNGASGATASDCLIAVAPISADYRQLLARPIAVWSAAESWETADMRGCIPFIESGVLYVYYTIAKTKLGVFSHVL